jgi:hypothetical protein
MARGLLPSESKASILTTYEARSFSRSASMPKAPISLVSQIVRPGCGLADELFVVIVGEVTAAAGQEVFHQAECVRWRGSAGDHRLARRAGERELLRVGAAAKGGVLLSVFRSRPRPAAPRS